METFSQPFLSVNGLKIRYLFTSTVESSQTSILFYSILAKEEEEEPNVEINNDEIDMGEDEDIDVESDDDDLDTKAEHGMFIDQKNTKTISSLLPKSGF